MDWWEELEGPLLGRYQIEGRLGSGGMADVFLAHDVRFESRKVAIKAPNLDRFPADQASELLERFHREVRRQGNDSIFGTVRLLDAGEVTDAKGVRRQFLVMDYMPGGSLGDALGGSPGRRERTHTLGEVNRWLPQVAATLDRLHARKILHRDVKPDNLLFDQDGNALLADLGIATSLDEVAGGGSMATMAGTMGPGSPGYQAPETLRGDKLAASDQFSLAVTVYEAITGALPMPAASRDGWIMALANWQPKDLRAHRPEIAPAAAEAVARALSAEPRLRFMSCSEFADALVQAASARPSAPPPPLPNDSARAVPPPSAATPARAAAPAKTKRGAGKWIWLVLPLLVLLPLGYAVYWVAQMSTFTMPPELEALQQNSAWEQARTAQTALHVRLMSEFSTAAGEPETAQSKLNAELDFNKAADDAAASLLAFDTAQQELANAVDTYRLSHADPAKLAALKTSLGKVATAGETASKASDVLSNRVGLAAKRTTKQAQVAGAPAAALAADASMVALEQDVLAYAVAVANLRKVVKTQQMGLARYEASLNGNPAPQDTQASEPQLDLSAAGAFKSCSKEDSDADGVFDCRDLCQTPARERSTVTRSGCPLNASTRLFFSRDNAELHGLEEALDEIAQAHKATPTKLIAVSGYGDRQEVPSVSETRALVVFQYLASKGVPAEQMLPPVGYADLYASRKGDEAAMDLDRRVEIQVEP